MQRINAPFAAQAPQDDGWHGFAHPFGGGFQQQRAGSRLGYQLSSYGTVAGAEKRSERYRDWLWGFHGAVGHQSVTVNAPENGRGTTTSFDLGVQARYNAGAQKGSYLFGNGRIGVEESDMTRRIGTDDFNVSHRARWTGWSGALTAGGGYRFALNDRLMFGPIASLSYTVFYRPDVTESVATPAACVWMPAVLTLCAPALVQAQAGSNLLLLAAPLAQRYSSAGIGNCFQAPQRKTLILLLITKRRSAAKPARNARCAWH